MTDRRGFRRTDTLPDTIRVLGAVNAARSLIAEGVRLRSITQPPAPFAGFAGTIIGA
jgi:hypothetical protein